MKNSLFLKIFNKIYLDKQQDGEDNEDDGQNPTGFWGSLQIEQRSIGILHDIELTQKNIAKVNDVDNHWGSLKIEQRSVGILHDIELTQKNGAKVNDVDNHWGSLKIEQRSVGIWNEVEQESETEMLNDQPAKPNSQWGSLKIEQLSINILKEVEAGQHQ